MSNALLDNYVRNNYVNVTPAEITILFVSAFNVSDFASFWSSASASFLGLHVKECLVVFILGEVKDHMHGKRCRGLTNSRESQMWTFLVISSNHTRHVPV